MNQAYRSLVLICIVLLPALTSCSHTVYPDYTIRDSWAYFAHTTGESPSIIDVFMVAPTVELGKDGILNAAMASPEYRKKLTGALNMQLGIYAGDAVVFAPYYRQATLAVFGLQKARYDKHLSIAYEDIRRAFLHFAAFSDRPFVLTGFSQGAIHILELLKEFFHDENYQDRLVAAYVLGWRITPDDLASYPHLKMAQSDDDVGVIVSFNSEAQHITSSLFVPEGIKTLSINPLNWRSDASPAGKELNKGACFTDHSGSIKSEIKALTGAYIDPVRGTLKLPDIREQDYPGILFEDGIYHLYEYLFFYRNLQSNIKERIRAFEEKNI